MSDQEFDVLDELYFVTSFTSLQQELGMADTKLKAILKDLLDKGWVKCFLTASEEAMPHEIDLDGHYREYYYLASKAGLLAHNGH